MTVITDYASLQDEVLNTLARNDLASDVDRFIQFAENKLYRTLNLRNEETALSVDISSGLAVVPTDFKMLKFAYYNTSPIRKLDWVTLEQMYERYSDRSYSSSEPDMIAREGSNFIFGPVAADATGGLKGIYYAKQDNLHTTDNSWYVTNAPEVLLYGALLEAKPHIQDDERIPIWQAYYTEAVKTLEIENRNAEYAKTTKMQRVA